jgi:hypothetical protein
MLIVRIEFSTFQNHRSGGAQKIRRRTNSEITLEILMAITAALPERQERVV